MTTEQAINLIGNAKKAADVFPAGSDTDDRYRRLARLVHPDAVAEPNLKKLADEAFTKLTRFRDEITGKAEPFAATKIGKWVVTGSLAKGDIADLYTCKDDIVLKIARSPKDNDLMEAEATALKALWGATNGKQFVKYLPAFYDSFKASDRRANIIDSATVGLGGDYRSLHDISAVFPDGIDFRHIVWMGNRLFNALGFIHNMGIVHGAITPAHLLYGPTNHGLMLVDFCYSVQAGKPLKAVPRLYRALYPKEVADKKPALPGTDVALAAAVLAGCAKKVPKRFHSLLIEWCRTESPKARPEAWKVADIWMKLAAEEYGLPSYTKLEMPVN